MSGQVTLVSRNCPAGIEMLRESAKAAQMKFDMAVTFHETWKPAAYDEDLHARMGTSYATQTFRVIRTALRREMVLALMRIWDRSKGTLRMEEMARAIRTDEVMKALVSERAKNMGWPSAEPDIRKTLNRQALQVTGTIAKYAPGTPGHPFLEDLRSLRHGQLAHRNLSLGATEGVSIADADIETFYQDNLAIYPDSAGTRTN